MKEQNRWFVQSTRPLARPEAVIQGPDYRFTVLTDRLLRLEYQPQGRFQDAPTALALCRDFPCPEFRVTQTETSLELVTGELHLYYNKGPFSPEGLRVQLAQSFATYGSIWNYGEDPRGFLGTARTLDQADGPVELDRGLLSWEGFSVLDDSAGAWFDSDGNLQPRQERGLDLYFFGYGHDYLACLRDFYRLSGLPPLVPRFALGNWWSRYYPYSESEYLALMDRFRQEEVPFSTAVIDMDWHLTRPPKGCGSGWTGYTWNRELFPDPARFLAALHDRGLHVTLNLHPADGVNAHEEAYPQMARALGRDPGTGDKIPFTPTDPEFMEAYFQYLHHPHEAMGVDFWWVDWQQGSHSAVPGLDPLFLLNHQHFLDSGRDGKEPMTFSRYAGLGSHRYPIGFSGDTITSWESLDFQPYFTANASNAGYGWWSHDIGGHMLGRRDDELTARWVQFGVFSPILRLHSSCSPFYGKEPWNYGPEAQRVITEFLRLRHRLIPYLYTMDHLSAREGLPLLRPMYYHNDVREAYSVPNQYWFGTGLIACPVTAPMDPETLLAPVRVWLPEGTYFDLFTGNVYHGGRERTMYRPLDQLPVLLPAGSILPLAADPMTSHLENPKILELLVCHGGDGDFTLVEDDCSHRQDAPVRRSRFTYTRTDAGTVLELAAQGAAVTPPDRVYRVILRGVHAPASIRTGHGEAPQWRYDPAEKQLHLTIAQAPAEGFRLELALSDPGVAGREVLPQVFDLLQRSQIAYSLKDRIYDTVRRGRSTAAILAELTRLALPHPLLEAVTELLTMDL